MVDNAPFEDVKSGSKESFLFNRYFGVVARDTETVHSLNCIVINMIADYTEEITEVLDV